MDFDDPQERLARRRTFGAVARAYADLRPTYPDALVDAVAVDADLERRGADARVLEIAPGPGQATRSLLARGWSVQGVELSPELAAVARERSADAVAQGRLRVDVAPFEEWLLPPEPFDLVFCATAWHWLDRDLRVAKAAAALRPGGVLAVVWTHIVNGGTPGFDEAAAPLFRRWDPDAEPWRGLTHEVDLAPQTGELAASEAFGDVGSRLFPAEVAYSADEVAALHGTYSSVLRLAPEQRAGLLGDLRELATTRFGGRVVRRYAFELVTARRTGGPRTAVGGPH